MSSIVDVLSNLANQTGFASLDWKNYVMILVAFVFMFLAIKFGFEPLLLVPISFGMLLVNMFPDIMAEGGLLHYFYMLDEWSILPSLIFMGVGAMTDFGPLIANPASFLLGAAAQFGIYGAYFLAFLMGFNGKEAAAISIIGGADGPTSIFLAGKLGMGGTLLGPIAVAAYSYMSLVPIIQPPIMKALTTKKERLVRMPQLRPVTKLEKITLEEPNTDLCLRILKGALGTYSEYHHLAVDEAVMGDAIRLSKRYLTEKALPDSAFDLIDRTMALVKTMNDMSANDVAELQAELAKLRERAKTEEPGQIMTELEWLHYRLINQISCILLAQLDSDTEFNKIATAEERIDYLQHVLDQLTQLAQQKRTQLESADLFAVVAKQTGIPLGKVQSKERDRLINAEATLKKRVVGQDHAVKIVLDAVFESRSGLNKKGQPMGSFFFLGPTGTGKTELSKALAEVLFGREDAMIRVDMSEYMEKFSVQRLIGAPPGYVGYDEGGQLTEAVRRRPYSVILLDEMEKAHPDVFNVLLQVLDDGRLTDGQGRQVSFKNTIIIMTSNVGSKAIADLSGKDEEEMRHQVDAAMAQTFRPEFLNRIDDIVVFHPLGMAQIEKIVDIQLADVRARLAKERMTLAITPAAKQMLAVGGLDPVFGARPLKRLVQREVVDAIAAAIIDGTVREGDQVTVDADKDGGFTVVCDNTPSATYEVPDAE